MWLDCVPFLHLFKFIIKKPIVKKKNKKILNCYFPDVIQLIPRTQTNPQVNFSHIFFFQTFLYFLTKTTKYLQNLNKTKSTISIKHISVQAIFPKFSSPKEVDKMVSSGLQVRFDHMFSSHDIFHLCSPPIFRSDEREQVQDIIRRFSQSNLTDVIKPLIFIQPKQQIIRHDLRAHNAIVNAPTQGQFQSSINVPNLWVQNSRSVQNKSIRILRNSYPVHNRPGDASLGPDLGRVCLPQMFVS